MGRAQSALADMGGLAKQGGFPCTQIFVLWLTAGNRKLTRVSLKDSNRARNQAEKPTVTSAGGVTGQPSWMEEALWKGGIQENVPVFGVTLWCSSLSRLGSWRQKLDLVLQYLHEGNEIRIFSLTKR